MRRCYEITSPRVRRYLDVELECVPGFAASVVEVDGSSLFCEVVAPGDD